MNSIREAERPKRSRVSPSEAIPTFLPFPRPEPGQEIQGRTDVKSQESYIHPGGDYFSGLGCLYCADPAKMFLLTEIEILFSEWSNKAGQRFYGSPDINIVQHTIKLWTVWDILGSEFNFPLCPRVRSGHCCFLCRPQCPGLAGLAACPWRGDDYFLATIISPSANQRLLSTQSDQSEVSIASLNITFCPHQSSHWWGHRQDYYYAGARTGKLILENIIEKCLLHWHCYELYVIWPLMQTDT